MFKVYAIYNRSRSKIYIGYTSDLVNRMSRHNKITPSKSRSFTAMNDGLWELIYSENFETRAGALKREKELKSFRGREFVKKLIR